MRAMKLLKNGAQKSKLFDCWLFLMIKDLDF